MTRTLELIKSLEESRAAAVILRIDSPGGTVSGSEALYESLRRLAAKKPTVAVVDGLAASGGYIAALGSDRIVARQTSLVGSIGVLFQYPQIKTLMDRLGVSLETIKSAPLKAEPNPFNPPSEEAKAVIQSMINDSFDWFVDLVAERRKLARPEALRLADGRIFTGRQALKEKLVDVLGGEEEIKAYFKSRKVDADLPVVDWKAPDNSWGFGLGSIASEWVKSLGYEVFPALGGLEKLSGDKLFLDGLLSVWQVGNN